MTSFIADRLRARHKNGGERHSVGFVIRDTDISRGGVIGQRGPWGQRQIFHKKEPIEGSPVLVAPPRCP